MGIVRLLEGKSTGYCEAKTLSDKVKGKPGTHDMPIQCKNALWNDTLKAVPAHKDEPIPGRCKHPAANRCETG